jgi:hypothetical protein
VLHLPELLLRKEGLTVNEPQQPEQIDWVAVAGDPPYQRRVTFEQIVVDPENPPDLFHPQITITRTAGKVTEIDMTPPADHTFAVFITATGSIHIALRPKTQ